MRSFLSVSLALVLGCLVGSLQAFAPVLTNTWVSSQQRKAFSASPSLVVLGVSMMPENENDLFGENKKNDPLEAAEENMDANSADSEEFLMELGAKAAAVAVLAVLLVQASTMAFHFVTEVFSFGASELGNEVLREVGNLFSFLGQIVAFLGGAAWEGAKVVVPAFGNAALDAGKAAAPVVMESAKSAAETAAPYIQDAASQFADATAPMINEASVQLNQASAPYVNEVTSTIQGAADSASQLVAPVKEAADSVVAPLKDVQIPSVELPSVELPSLKLPFEVF